MPALVCSFRPQAPESEGQRRSRGDSREEEDRRCLKPGLRPEVCEALDLHTALGEQGHEIAAGLAVVVAVEGTAVDVGQLRCRDLELLRLAARG